MEQGAKIMRERDAMQRYSLGRTKVREVAEECGAVVRIGRAFRIDRDTMDAYFDKLRQGTMIGPTNAEIARAREIYGDD